VQAKRNAFVVQHQAEDTADGHDIRLLPSSPSSVAGVHIDGDDCESPAAGAEATTEEVSRRVAVAVWTRG
jgi:hypothetical protein